MEKIYLAFIQLRLQLLESVLLQDKSAKKVYLEDLKLLRAVIAKQAETDSEKLITLIDEHLLYIERLPTQN
ncbi:hypothetical protein EDL99_11080 [Ornithobacterium rhinotracheale]|uniref:hypothetical protein n=1 Tax=Ornithobacterium rhinotracheale TaxID=28251 RepID=UPI00129C295A|nr:hypothetical protein [Ornithobacterium rhinotracheale]MRJ09395.1 hypothetical protein [Ornithobacterium rhinotracheale]UOH78730.1 hypothetical protein MT996_04475 [Ornithobacterium rhinotracheale]